jgi:hypothetical protein
MSANDWKPGNVGDAAMRRYSAEVYGPGEDPRCPWESYSWHNVSTCTRPECEAERRRDLEDRIAREREREVESMIDALRNERED